MVYEIYSLDASDTGALLIIALKEMGIYGTDKVNFIQSSFFKIHDPEWTEHQPLERMPYMVDTETGIELYETRTMAKYIAGKERSSLVPSEANSVAFWQFDKAFYTEAVHVCPWTGLICLELVYAPGFYKRDSDMKIVEMADKQLRKTFKGYERILGKQTWLAGNQLTLVDLFHVVLIKMCRLGGALTYTTDGTYPHVQHWYEALESRPSVQEAMAIKLEAAKALMG